tara:strand:- start:692 stop:1027 length:336 start_codon:yes stop_codon:yes gene_type:complete
MAEIKDFGNNFVVDREAPKFMLHNEEFECVKSIQGKVLLNLTTQVASDDPAKQAAMITDFFNYVLTDESYVRFDALLESKDRIVPVEALGEIVGWITEQLTARPEAQPEAS